MVYNNVMAFCRVNHIPVYKLEKLCGIANGTIAKWRYSDPSLESLKKLEKGTGIKVRQWVDDIYE